MKLVQFTSTYYHTENRTPADVELRLRSFLMDSVDVSFFHTFLEALQCMYHTFSAPALLQMLCLAATCTALYLDVLRNVE